MRTFNKLDKVVLVMVAVVMIVLTPKFAWAVGNSGFGLQLGHLVSSYLKDFALTWLIPQTENTPVMMVSFLTVTMATWAILTRKNTRKLFARTGAFPVAIMGAGLVFPLLWIVGSFVLSYLSGWMVSLLIIGLILGGVGILVATAKMILGIYKKLLDHSTDVAKKEDPGYAYAIVGSLFFFSLLNSSAISNSGVYYLPTWLCLIFVAFTFIFRLDSEPNTYLCPHCNFENPERYRICGRCGKPPQAPPPQTNVCDKCGQPLQTPPPQTDPENLDDD